MTSEDTTAEDSSTHLGHVPLEPPRSADAFPEQNCFLCKERHKVRLLFIAPHTNHDGESFAVAEYYCKRARGTFWCAWTWQDKERRPEWGRTGPGQLPKEILSAESRNDAMTVWRMIRRRRLTLRIIEFIHLQLPTIAFALAIAAFWLSWADFSPLITRMRFPHAFLWWLYIALGACVLLAMSLLGITWWKTQTRRFRANVQAGEQALLQSIQSDTDAILNEVVQDARTPS